jgi:hypothetical protein
MELTVKSLSDARFIAKALGRHSEEAARLYLDGFERRQFIERQARAALYGG